MSKEKRKDSGWIETIYGDFWAKRKKLIIAGFVFPLIFCFLLYLEFSLVLSWMQNTPFNLEALFRSTMERIGYDIFLILFFPLLGFSIVFWFSVRSFLGFFELPLTRTWREVFKEEKKSPRFVLVKNIVISLLRFVGKLFHFLTVAVLYGTSFAPALIWGGLIYLYLDLYSIPNVINFVSLLPGVGDTLKQIATYTAQTFGRHLGEIQSIPQVCMIPLLGILILLMFPLFDRIQTSVLRKQRGNIKRILRNGFILILYNINFLDKLGRFLYTTFHCLFTDQTKTSLDVHVINDMNVDKAMHKILSTNQRCYIARIPFVGAELISEIERFPEPWQDEIVKIFKEEIERSWYLKLLLKLVKEKRTRPMMRGIAQKLSRHEAERVIFAVSENGCVAYALIGIPPPTYMTRKASILWCNDPTAKERILDEIDKLEST